MRVGSGREGYDYAWDRPDIRKFRTSGISFVMRYLPYDNSGNGKFLTRAEADALHAIGIPIGLNLEVAAGTAKGGYAVGAYHGRMANAATAKLGAPPSVPVFYSIDWDVTAFQMDGVVKEYFRGVLAEANHPVGIYGGYRAVSMSPVPFKWQTYAWSGGRIAPNIHIYQYQNNVSEPGGKVDRNRTTLPIVMWGDNETLTEKSVMQYEQYDRDRLNATLDQATKANVAVGNLVAELVMVQGRLTAIEAAGGGVTPEELQTALLGAFRTLLNQPPTT